MYGTETFKDLIEMIETHEQILFNCKQNLSKIELFLLQDDGAPKGLKHKTSYTDYDTIHGDRTCISAEMLNKLMSAMEDLKDMIFLEEEIIKSLIESKQAILDKLKDLEGLEYKVAYKKYAERKPVKAIWSELQNEGSNYSFSYIEKISAKV